MRNKQAITFKLVAVLTALAILNSGCVIEDVLRALAMACDTVDWTITRAEEPSPATCTPADCSLRQAITVSNTCHSATPHTLHLTPGTYLLTKTGVGEDRNATGDLDITYSLNILGENGSIVDGNAMDRVFDIRAGATVTMNNLTIRNGYGAFGSNGVGIRNSGDLTATNVLITGNHFTISANGGAGIFNTGTATISHSAIVNNVAEEGAGGITSYGTLNLDNVTISGNRGYGLFLVNTPTRISFSTIANNYPSQQIWNTDNAAPEMVQISNSIVTGTAGDGNCLRPVASLGFNIDGAAPGSDRTCAFSQPNDLNGVDPLLQPLADNGGGTLTHALAPASPALDSADPATCPATDQRGVARPQGPGCDRGAYEADTLTTSAPIVAASPTPTSTLTPTPAPQAIPFTLVLTQNANCRSGPGTAYESADAYPAGQSLLVDGRNEMAPWWWQVLIPNSKKHCWVSSASGQPQGDPGLLPVIQVAPPVAPPSNDGGGGAGAPAAPSKLAITDRQCTSKKYTVTLGWNDNANNESGYHVYRDGALIATLGANAGSYTDNPPGSGPYTYSVEAFNAAGASAQPTVHEAGCLI